MNRTFLPLVGLLILAGSVWFWLNPGKLFTGKKEEAVAYIYEVKPNPTRGEFHQDILYAYVVDGKVYTGTEAINNRNGIPYTGSRISVNYSKKKPEKNKVSGFYTSTDRNTYQYHYTDTAVSARITLYGPWKNTIPERRCLTFTREVTPSPAIR